MHPANPRIYPVGNPVSRALRLALLFTLLSVATGAPLASQAPDSIPPVPAADVPAAGDPVITQALLPILREHRVPALAAAVVTSAGLERVGVIGVRKQGTSTPVTIEDSWHLGSDTKAMTAALIGRLVERGQLDWETRMSEVFPEQTVHFDQALARVTVRQLLAHRAGLPRNLDLNRYRSPKATVERARAVREYLGQPPDYSPGTRTLYSNLGYIIAGAVVEQRTGQSWEAAVRQEIFAPLEMDSAGFGGLGTPGLLDQPWPHRQDGRPMPNNGPNVDNPPVLGPAGRVHCTIADWAKFIADQLRGARGEAALLQPNSYQALHTPVAEGHHSLGWLVLQRDWADGTVLHHAGDNTMNHASVWIAPRRGFALLACCNQGGKTAARATDQAISALLRAWNEHGGDHAR